MAINLPEGSNIINYCRNAHQYTFLLSSSLTHALSAASGWWILCTIRVHHSHPIWNVHYFCDRPSIHTTIRDYEWTYNSHKKTSPKRPLHPTPHSWLWGIVYCELLVFGSLGIIFRCHLAIRSNAPSYMGLPWPQTTKRIIITIINVVIISIVSLLLQRALMNLFRFNLFFEWPLWLLSSRTEIVVYRALVCKCGWGLRWKGL